jgi:predicted dehydrogenase
MVNHILIIGLGSIGRRHLKHFRSIGVERIDALRSGKATLLDDGQLLPDNTYNSLEAAFSQNPQAVVICTPSSLHTEYILYSLKLNIPILCEKPIISDFEHAYLILKESKNDLVYIAHNLRFHKAFNWIKDKIENKAYGLALMAQAHFGAYLPDWHPWEDYKKSYAAVKRLGGGASLTHTHELDYLTWIFGEVLIYSGIKSDINELGTNVDEQSCFVLKHKSGVLSSVSLSLNQKPPKRYLQIQFSEGTLYFNILDCTLTFQYHNGEIENYSHLFEDYDLDETYRFQAESFLKVISGEKSNLCTLEEGLKLVEIITNFK